MLICVRHRLLHLILEYFLTAPSVYSLSRYLVVGGVVLVDG